MNVLLFGDSICHNYSEYVSNNIGNGISVYYVKDNGRFTLFSLRYLHEWFNAIGIKNNIVFDIIHFNCGLWDVLRLSNEESTFLSEDEYRMGLIRLIKRIRSFYPDAKIIFALSTKIIGNGFEPGISTAERRNEDIIRFNMIAKDVCTNEKIIIDDLWSVSETIPLEARSDNVHFETPLGISMLGNQVIKCLKDALREG